MFHDEAKRLAWDDRMNHLERVESEGTASNEFIQYFQVAKSNLPVVSQRDCLVRVQKKENYPREGEFVYAFTHHVDERFPENANGLIRSKVVLNGYHFKPSGQGEGTIVEWFANLNVLGSIPGWLFRKATVKLHLNQYTALVRYLNQNS